MECDTAWFEEQVAWIQVFELGEGISSPELGQSSLILRRGIFEAGEGTRVRESIYGTCFLILVSFL